MTIAAGVLVEQAYVEGERMHVGNVDCMESFAKAASVLTEKCKHSNDTRIIEQYSRIQ